VYIYDRHNSFLAEYNYNVSPKFVVEKHLYALNPSQPKVSIQINTNTPLNISHNGRTEWISNQYNDNNNLQTIKIDMSSYTFPIEKTWSLELSCEGQRE